MSVHALPEPRWLQQVAGRSLVTLLSPERHRKLMESGGDITGCGKRMKKVATACEVQRGDAIYVPAHWGWSSCAVESREDGTPDFSLAVGFGGYTTGWPDHFHSVAEGDLKQLKTQLQADASIVHTADGGTRNTAIELACAVGDLKMAKLLRNAGARHNDTGSFSRMYPLHFAAQYGHSQVVEWLLKANADPRVRANDERSPLHLAAEAGHDETVALLLKAGGEAHGTYGKDKFTAVHIAAQNGHVGVLKALREGGAELSAADAKGCEAPMVAAYRGHLEVLDFLFGVEGLNPNAKCTQGKAVAHIAAENGLTQVLDVLKKWKANLALKDDEKQTPLHRAVRLGVTAVIEWYAAAGSKKISPQKTPGLLHAAAWANQTEAVRLLLKHGANISAPEPHGGALAIELSASREMLYLLQEASGGEVETASLHRAAKHGHLFFLREVAEMRPVKQALQKEIDGLSAVHQAAHGGHPDVLSWLCSQVGMDCSVRAGKEKHRQSPLHLAAAGEGEVYKGARLQAVQYLIRQGCPPDDFDFNGMTPLEFAGAVGHLSVVEFLVTKHDADIAMLWRAKRDKYLKPEIERWVTKAAKAGSYEKWLELGWPPAGPGAIPTGERPTDPKNQLKKSKKNRAQGRSKWSQAEPIRTDDDDDSAEEEVEL